MLHRVKRAATASYRLAQETTDTATSAVATTTARGARAAAAAATTTTTAAARARTTATTATSDATTDTDITLAVRPNWRSMLDSTSSSSTPSPVQTSSASPSSAPSSSSRAATTNARPVASSSPSLSSSSRASSAVRASGSSGSVAADGSLSSSSSSGGSSGGAIAGGIIAALVVVAAIVGFFVWKKKKARNARGSGTNLFAGAPGSGGDYGAAGAGAYNKRHETGDSELFAGSSANASSGWAGEEKFSAGTVPPAGAMGFGREQAPQNNPWEVPSAGAGQRAVSPPQPHAAYASPTMHQGHQSWASSAPSGFGMSGSAYPPLAPASSTANLLSHQGPPASLGAPLAPTPAAALDLSSAAASAASFNDAQHQSIEQRELAQELENRRLSLLAASAGAAGVGAGAGAVAVGASPFGESEGQGEIRVVKGTFDPSLEDELVLYPGDRIQVLMKYDDGWALGLNLSSGPTPAKGVFPFDCLGELAPAPSPAEVRSPVQAIPAALIPGSPPPVGAAQQRQSLIVPQQAAPAPVDPASIPLPPPTPTPASTSMDGLASIAEDERPTSPFADPAPAAASRPLSPASGMSINTSTAPQLAPLTLGGGNDSPLSASFPPLGGNPPTSRPSMEGGLSPAPTVKQNKRHSSLIASRDADLFVALGEVLGETPSTAAPKEGEEKKE
ncbi:hypothetical protein JCM10213_002410 [Rhodosporidiobolus nylandii]